MRLPARAALCMIVAGSLLAASGAWARTRGDNLFAGVLAGAAVGALAGSVFAAPSPPPPFYVYRARPGWGGYPPPRIEIYHGSDWDDPTDDWED